jgi:hypothetical protein
VTPKGFGGEAESCSKQFSITSKLISEEVMKKYRRPWREVGKR